MTTKYFWMVAIVSCVGFFGCGKKSEEAASTAPTAGSPAPASSAPAATTAAPGLGDNLESDSPGTPLKTSAAIDAALAIAGKNVSGFGTMTLQSEVLFDISVSNPFEKTVSFATLGNTTVTGAYSQPTLQAQGFYDPRSDWFGIQVAPSRTDREHFYTFRDQVNILGKIIYSTDAVLLFQEEGTGSTELLKVAGFSSKNPTIQRFRMNRVNQTQNSMRLSVIRQIFQSVFSGTPTN